MTDETAPRSPWPRRAAIVLGILLAAALGGAATGYFLRLDLPSVRRLEDYRPPLITRLLDAHEEALHQFAEERRILVSTPQISRNLKLAILAAEDPRFYQHVGVDPTAIGRAALKDLLTLSKAQGGSTITQQLARNLFLVPKKLWRRKIQEALLALEIERTYTKDEILEFYVNQIYLGHGRYGFEAAASYYFAKPAADLTLAEAALLAGLAQRPEALSPYRNPEAAVRRRNHILQRMVIEGFVDQAEADAAKSEELELTRAELPDIEAPHFVEEVRRSLVERYGEVALYQEGLVVRTTIDPAMQAAANQAMLRGLHALDKRRGWRGPMENLRERGVEDLESVDLEEWNEPLQAGARLPALVVSTRAGSATVRIGDRTGSLGVEAVAWTGRSNPAAILRPGDVVLVEVLDTGEPMRLSLDQRPEVEGALIALEPSSGEVKAMIGGYDFRRSQFNRATQAYRQTGSVFKPFVYAAALYAGLTPADVFFDEPTLLLDRQTGSVYQPNNYERDYNGVLTLRGGLEQSINIATVRLLNRIGYEPVIRLARRMGITSPLPPYPSLALGSAEVNLLELTAAYGALANQGVLVEPHFIRSVTGPGGESREQARPEALEAVRPEVAYVLGQLLFGAVERGTGKGARVLGRPVGGKTGTTDDYSDAWFVGFTPSLAVGVWVGYDQKVSLGPRETGARAALPIWIDFMEAVLRDAPEETLPRPGNVVQVPIDRTTGLRAGLDTGCTDVILESFLAGTEPSTPCGPVEHYRLSLPYFLQRFPIDDDLKLRLTLRDLFWLTTWEGCDVTSEEEPRLETRYAGATTRVPFRLVGAPELTAADQPPVSYFSRLIDTPGLLYQDDVLLPYPDDGEETREKDLPPTSPEGAYRWLGLDGLDAVVVFVRGS